MRTLVVLAALAAALLVTAPAGAAVKKLNANLSGAQETAPGGDPDGSGTAKLSFNRAKKRVCFNIRVKNIDDVLAAHIHRGGKGVAGSIEVDLIAAPRSGTHFTGCTKGVARSLIKAILKHPRRFYVNVHTMAYQGGAIRGQLHKP
jgi:CHRD domain-containing protein